MMVATTTETTSSKMHNHKSVPPLGLASFAGRHLVSVKLILRARNRLESTVTLPIYLKGGALLSCGKSEPLMIREERFLFLALRRTVCPLVLVTPRRGLVFDPLPLLEWSNDLLYFHTGALLSILSWEVDSIEYPQEAFSSIL